MSNSMTPNEGVGYYKDYIKRDTDEGPMAGYQFIPDGPLGTLRVRVRDIRKYHRQPFITAS